MERNRLLGFSKRSASRILIILSALLFIICTSSFAQDPEEELKTTDTIKVNDTKVVVENKPVVDTVKKHSAHKATIYSMALPGLGQAYNKKYWKIPIIYAGFGYLAYNISKNNKEVKAFTEAYRFLSNGDSIPPTNKYANSNYDADQLLSGREFYMRNVELSVIFTAVLYLLNVVDAAVDAHFYDYDISEDLSLNVQPIIIRTPQQPFGTGGIRLCMNF